jgi:hypothetical protein
MSAWRPYDNLIAGELDNTEEGRVKGWLEFVGKKGRVTVDLVGDFHRDIRGTIIRLHNPEPAARRPGYMEGFADHHTGEVGDMTAGLEPQDYVEYPYLEWYSDQNGRIVLELKPSQIQIIGQPKPWQTETPVSRADQEAKLGAFMTELAQSIAANYTAQTNEQGKSSNARPSPTEEQQETATQENAAEESPELNHDEDHEISR